MKKGFILGMVITIILSTGLTLANNMISDVYYSSFPITVNGQAYTSEMPILNYQGRTYLPLREFGNATGVNVDFQNNTILVDNYKKNNLFNFSANSLYILEALSYVHYNNDQICEAYIQYFSNNPFSTPSTYSSTINASIKSTNDWKKIVEDNQFLVWYTANAHVGGIDASKAASLTIKIENYLAEVENFNNLATEGITNNHINENLINKWEQLSSTFYEIDGELIELFQCCTSEYYN